MPIFQIWERTSVQYVWLPAALLGAATAGLGSSPVTVAWRDSTWLFSYRTHHDRKNRQILDYILPRKKEMVKSIIVPLILDFLPSKTTDRSLPVLAQNFRKTQWTEKGKKCLSSPKPAYCCSSSVWTNNRRSQNPGNMQGAAGGEPRPSQGSWVTRTSKWRSGLRAWVWLYWETMHPLHNLTPIKTEIQSRYSLTSKAKQVTERGRTNPGLRPRPLPKNDPLPLPWQ